MTALAQAIVFQVVTATLCAFPTEIPKQGRLFRGTRNKSDKILCCALGAELSASSLEKLNEGAIFSVSSGLRSKALINRGKASC